MFIGFSFKNSQDNKQDHGTLQFVGLVVLLIDEYGKETLVGVTYVALFHFSVLTRSVKFSRPWTANAQ